MARPAIEPMPPVASGAALPWDQPVDDAVGVLARARASYGDTFVVDSGPDRYLFVFSPTAVTELYRLEEAAASKGVADWRMLRRKLPEEIFLGRRTFPHDLFGRADAASYLERVEQALDDTVAELGEGGEVDVFDLCRRLGHRVGLASWGGPGSAVEPQLSRLIAAFDQLDGSDAFVHPDAMAAVAASGFRAERAALDVVTQHFALGAAEVRASATLAEAHPLFARIVDAWSDAPGRAGDTGLGHDVALVHVASMSNLFAALGWALVDLVSSPAAARVADEPSAWAERCVLESTRLAQRSIMSRYVMAPVSLSDGATTYLVEPGVTLATLLPLTNTSAGPGLDVWDPDRWKRRRLARPPLACTELVTVFGHGHHTCPAQPFSLAAMTAAVGRLLRTFAWEPLWPARPIPVPAQIGGVARAAGPTPVRYRRISA